MTCTRCIIHFLDGIQQQTFYRCMWLLCVWLRQQWVYPLVISCTTPCFVPSYLSSLFCSPSLSSSRRRLHFMYIPELDNRNIKYKFGNTNNNYYTTSYYIYKFKYIYIHPHLMMWCFDAKQHKTARIFISVIIALNLFHERWVVHQIPSRLQTRWIQTRWWTHWNVDSALRHLCSALRFQQPLDRNPKQRLSPCYRGPATHRHIGRICPTKMEVSSSLVVSLSALDSWTPKT